MSERHKSPIKKPSKGKLQEKESISANQEGEVSTATVSFALLQNQGVRDMSLKTK